MKITALGLFCLVTASIAPAPAPARDYGDNAARVALTALADGAQRSDANRARNVYRHPVDTLLFFGLKPDMTVVELWPSGGWYTEIIAPYVNAKGQYYAAGFDQASTVPFYRKVNTAFADKLAARPDLYGNVKVTELAPPTKLAIAPAGTADMVLTFRNLHNWMADGQAEAVMKAAYRALKPGGIFGLVEHRGDPAVSQDPKANSGYVNQDYAIELARAAGFKLVGTSEINANPRDDKNHPKGVWTLPPSFRLGDKDRAKYRAIGESDRMTLKFVKPVE